jgi:hypothetical protein
MGSPFNVKFDEKESEEIKIIVSNLIDLGAYLYGSRSKHFKFKHNLRFDYDTDWDFAVQNGVDWNICEIGKKLSSLGELILRDFRLSRSSTYYENNVVCVLEHKQYPHITVIVMKDLLLWKRTWDKLGPDFWYDYIWKHGGTKEQYINDKRKWKIRVDDIMKELMRAHTYDLRDYM